MKMNAPLFFLGLLVLITPFLGIPSVYESIVLMVLGIVIMTLTYSKMLFGKSNQNLTFDFKKEEKPIVSNFFHTDVFMHKIKNRRKKIVTANSNVTHFDPLNGPNYEE
jgi:hypothetical protein